MPTLHSAFYDRAAADHAIEDLIANGISADDISIVMSSATKDEIAPPKLDADITKGAVVGGVGGTLAAAVGGVLLGGALTVATGGAALPFIVAGPLAAAFAGGISGLAVGVLAGGLTGAGVAEADAKAIETHVKNGAVVVAVQVTTQNAPDVDEILRRDNRGAEPTA